ncbi:glycopeptide antibiotics resistance protein [Neobacillus niacini]|uniref:VanZ family protein n=1 Tax=Neobacillus niacini TaxID=86668 RepID=UPI0028596C75|nr:VanZ family protein [Neobacillus niacini]MDR7078343.1 glycopeptide antibiotics resistance protein [Neobacillus niacini]
MKKFLLLSLIAAAVLFLILSPVLIRLNSYLHPVVLGVVFLCMVVAVFFFTLLIRKETIQLRYSYFRTLLILYTIALLILLFFRPGNQTYQAINLVPFSTIAFYLSAKVNGLISFYNLAANIVLFIPFGLFLKVKKVSPLQLFYLPILFISLIELLQYYTRRGSLDIDDLILNVLGFFIGYLLYPLFNRILKVSFN